MEDTPNVKENLLPQMAESFKKHEREMREKVAKAMKDEIVKKMQVRLVKYYKHWKDYDLLTCILAVIGLVLAVVEVSYIFLTFYSTKLHLTTSTGMKRH